MHRVDELHSLRGPKVVLASQATLAAGPARTLLQDFASNPRNLVLWPVHPPVRLWAGRGSCAGTIVESSRRCRRHVVEPERTVWSMHPALVVLGACALGLSSLVG